MRMLTLAPPRVARSKIVLKKRKPRPLVSSGREIDKRIAGKHIAIIGDKVVVSGKSPMEVWKRARKLYPKRKPLLAFVPKADVLLPIRVRASRLKRGGEVQEESGIDPNDPIFDIALGRRKARDWGKGTENASEEVDETVYG